MFIRSIQLVSDIHLEKTKKYSNFKQTSGTLALCGDIGNPMSPTYKKFIHKMSKKYQRVLLISGNHEYYQRGHNLSIESPIINIIDNQINAIVKKYRNVYYLNNKTINLWGYTIAGTTLWSKYKNVNQYETIIPQEYKKNVEWLSNTINNNNKLIILTHHLPTEKILYKYKYKNNQDRFVSDLEYLIKDPVKYWFCGHSHIQNEIMLNGVKIAINANTLNLKSIKID